MTTTTGPVTAPVLVLNSFSTLKDYRRLNRGNIRHSLLEIIFLTISAAVSGITTYEEAADFGRLKIAWLRQYFPYKYGTASHDTLGEFYSKINPKEFSKCLLLFMSNLQNANQNVVAIDGKTVRGFLTEEGYPLHILSAFCTANSISIGEETVHGKENEIVAIPRLLDLICLEAGAVVTIDGIGCQREIAAKIIDKGANYLLQVKGNQKNLLGDIEDSFPVKKVMQSKPDIGLNHGRIETRICSVISDLEFIDNIERWKDLKSIVRVESHVIEKKTGKESNSTRYYISSLLPDAELMNIYARKHWQIESMHWSLDVIFGEDYQAKRNQTAIENANLISKLAISLLVDEKTQKKSKPRKRLAALLDDEYRQLILKI